MILQPGAVLLPLPPCRVIITDYNTNFHLEVIESLSAKFPFLHGSIIKQHLRSSNQRSFLVNIPVKRNSQSSSWVSYANSTTMPHVILTDIEARWYRTGK
jgi:hypothetical protein